MREGQSQAGQLEVRVQQPLRVIVRHEKSLTNVINMHALPPMQWGSQWGYLGPPSPHPAKVHGTIWIYPCNSWLLMTMRITMMPMMAMMMIRGEGRRPVVSNLVSDDVSRRRGREYTNLL